MNEPNPEVESSIHAACDAEDYDTAATIAIQRYGPEVLGFLHARLRDETAASEVFAIFCEDLWRGFAGFQFRCPARVWAYTLARHAANRYARAPHRKGGHNVPLSRAGAVKNAMDRVRTTTLAYLRTEVKSRMRELREELPLEDQTLIILRVDKGLSWRELAEVLSYDGETPSEETLAKESARLRKRFQLAKDRLRELAVAAGLIGGSDDP